MRIGKLRHRMQVQENQETVDQYGERTANWVLLDTVYAAIEPISAGERIRAGMPQMDVTHKITMRYHDYLGLSDTTLHPKYRLVYATRNFRIRSVINPEERNRTFVVMAEETDA